MSLVSLTFCRFPVTASSSHYFNNKWFVELLVLPLVSCRPKPAVRRFPFFLAKFISRIFLMSLIPVLVGFLCFLERRGFQLTHLCILHRVACRVAARSLHICQSLDAFPGLPHQLHFVHVSLLPSNVLDTKMQGLALTGSEEYF